MICDVTGCDRVAAWMVECGSSTRRFICDVHKREHLANAVWRLGHGDPETEAMLRKAMESTAHPLTGESLN